MNDLLFCASVRFFSGRHLEMKAAFQEKFGEHIVSSSHAPGILFVWTNKLERDLKVELQDIEKIHDIKLGISSFREV